VLAGDGCAETIEVFLDELAIAEHDAGALDHRGVAPGGEGGGGGFDGGVYFSHTADWAFGDDLTGGRIEDGGAAGHGAPLAGDVVGTGS
jgi:hypothetical protein